MLFSSWLPTKAFVLSDLPVVNECFHPYSQCAKKCARCPKVENSVASEPSKSTSQCIAVCTKRHFFGGPQSRDLSAQPGAAEISGRSQEQPGASRRAQQEELPYTLNLTSGLIILCVPPAFLHILKNSVDRAITDWAFTP